MPDIDQPQDPEPRSIDLTAETVEPSAGLWTPLTSAVVLKSYGRDVRQVATLTLLLVVFGLGIVVAGVRNGWAAGLLWSLACTALGWMVGFLFGMPKTVQGNSGSPVPARQGKSQDEEAEGQSYKKDKKRSGPSEVVASILNYRQRVNTNLEQVSDWLTKILVGIGLTQLNHIPDELNRASWKIAASLGGPALQSFALGLILYFSVLGFLAGYLITRLFIQRALFEAESRYVDASSSEGLDDLN